MEKFTNYSLRFNRRNKLDKDGKASIEVRIYLKVKATNNSTGISITPEGWNADKNLL